MPPDVLKLLNSGDTAWVLASSALVLLMTPGLAFFYGGMVAPKNVLDMLMMNFATIGIVSVLWVLYGYSLAFGKARREPRPHRRARHIGLQGHVDLPGVGHHRRSWRSSSSS